MIRAEDIDITTQQTGGLEKENTFCVTVIDCQYHGRDYLVRASYGPGGLYFRAHHRFPINEKVMITLAHEMTQPASAAS